MNRNVWMAVAFVCTASAGAAAQSGASATSAADKTITVTGCVQNISSSAPGGSTEKGFLLTNAMMGSASTSSAAATPGSTEGATRPAPSPTQAGTAAGTPTGTSGAATSSSAAMGSSYVLSGKDSELKNHVGHKVEVTGTVDAKMSSTTSTSTSTPSSSTTTSSSTMTANPKLTVTSVKMIASDCSAK